MIVGYLPIVAPAVEGIYGLALVLGFLISFGLLYLWRNTLGDAFRTIAAWIGGVRIGVGPFHIHPFSWLADALVWIDSVVDNALSSAAEGTGAGAMWLFHQAADQMLAIGGVVSDLALATEGALARVVSQTIPGAFTQAERAAQRAVGALAGQVETLSGRVGGEIAHGIDRVRHELTYDLEVLRRGIDRTSRGIEATLTHDIAWVNERVGTAERTIERDAGRIHRIEKRLGATAFAGIVAAALVRLGWDWIKCPALKSLNKKHGCTPWKALEDALAPALDILIAVNVCDIARLMSLAANTASPILTELVGYGNAALCHGNIPPLPQLVVTRTANPTPVAPLAL